MGKLSNKIINYLEENEEKLLPEYQTKYKSFLIENGFNPESSFVQFMSLYSDEIYGAEGHLSDVVADLIDYTESSFNFQLHNGAKIPNHFISITDDITEYYLLYNKNDESVLLFEDANAENVIQGKYDKKWKTFNKFLIDFFEIEDE